MLLTILLVWFATSIPVGMLVGRMLANARQMDEAQTARYIRQQPNFETA